MKYDIKCMKYESKKWQNHFFFVILRSNRKQYMPKVKDLKMKLKPGEVYRREDLAQWSKSVDRHLEELRTDGILDRLSYGLYYVPMKSTFGKMPPDESKLVRAFLKDDFFLLTSPNAYNSLGVGTTQLYNLRVVYNRKRHGVFKLGNRTFYFRKKPDFPLKATEEFLLIDLVNNLDQLAEDQNEVLENVKSKLKQMDKTRMKRFLAKYGDVKTKKILSASLQ